MNTKDDYSLIDSGDGYKLERFGPYTLARPCAQAVWQKSLGPDVWQKADATFTRVGETHWEMSGTLCDSWQMTTCGITFKISPTEFGHLGIFVEQQPLWEKLRTKIRQASRPIQALNLFAYSGGATIACAQAGAHVCHLDASKGMVSWARENAKLNGLEDAPIRWIVEDVQKFLDRELRREHLYDLIILDPPTFGRGSKGEVFKIEKHILPLLQKCRSLLSKKPLGLLFSCHTPGFTPTVLKQLLIQTCSGLEGTITCDEMLLEATFSIPRFSIPSGSYAYYDFKSS